MYPPTPGWRRGGQAESRMSRGIPAWDPSKAALRGRGWHGTLPLQEPTQLVQAPQAQEPAFQSRTWALPEGAKAKLQVAFMTAEASKGDPGQERSRVDASDHGHHGRQPSDAQKSWRLTQRMRLEV